jgi:very-short-patch-repair endonuclease
MAMLADHSATTLWTLRPGTARPIHVLVPDGQHGATPHGVIVHRSRILEPRDIRIHRGLPVTSPARAMLDIAATLPERDLGYILNEGLTKRLLTERDIYELLRRAGRHPGRHTLTNLMANWTGTLTESQAQRQLLELIRDAGLPLPRTEVPLLDYRADMFWPELKLIVEVDGYGVHGTRSAFERDRRRDARLRAAGYTVIRFAASDIEHRPLAVIAALAQNISALYPGLV